MKDQIEKLIGQMVEQGLFFQDAVEDFETKYISKVLEASGGNQSKAAKSLGMHRNTLSRKMEEYHLSSRNGSRHASARAPRARLKHKK